MLHFVGRLFLSLILTTVFVFGGMFVLNDDVADAMTSKKVLIFSDDMQDNKPPTYLNGGNG